jgi:hypothetical protein
LSNIFSNHRSNFEAPEFTEVYIEKMIDTTITMAVKRSRNEVIGVNQFFDMQKYTIGFYLSSIAQTVMRLKG